MADLLLVEDNPADVRLFHEAVREHGGTVRVEVASNGEDALRRIRSRQPDLIVLDLNLPRVTGYEVLEHVKTDPKLRHIPVIVFTTSESETDVFRAYDLHANCYLRKPADLDGYMRAIHAFESFWLDVVRLPQAW